MQAVHPLTELQASCAGDIINAYTPTALFLGSATIQSVQYTGAPKAAAPNRQDIVFGGTFKGYTWLKVCGQEQLILSAACTPSVCRPWSCRLLLVSLWISAREAPAASGPLRDCMVAKAIPSGACARS
jgi:hypothetical protein